MAEYKNVGDHAEDLADGRMVGPGETIEISDDDIQQERNADLLSRRTLLKLESQGEAVEATEAAVKLAKEHDIALTSITGTGAKGGITKEDVERHIAGLHDAGGRE